MDSVGISCQSMRHSSKVRLSTCGGKYVYLGGGAPNSVSKFKFRAKHAKTTKTENVSRIALTVCCDDASTIHML